MYPALPNARGPSAHAQHGCQWRPLGVLGFVPIYNQEMSLNSFAFYNSSFISWIINSSCVYSMKEYASEILEIKKICRLKVSVAKMNKVLNFYEVWISFLGSCLEE